MRTLFTLMLIISVAFAAHAVAVSEIRISGHISFYNYSNNDYNVSDHHITVGTTVYDVNSLTISSGNLNVPAGGTITFSGFSFKADFLVNPNSVALWYPGTFPGTPTHTQMVDFIQWGDTAQPYEDLAIQAGRWTAGDFIDGEPDFERTTFNFTGSNEWTALNNTGIADVMSNVGFTVAPNPFSNAITVNITNGLTDAVQCQLIDHTGRLLNSVEAIREGEIKLETEAGAPAGIYFVRVVSANGTSEAKRILKL